MIQCRVYILIAIIFLPGLLIGQTINSFPHSENFEPFATCPQSCLSPCALTNGWINETTADDMDWITDDSGTPTNLTGPTANGGADHNPGIAGGKYLYLESTSCANSTAYLETPLLDFTAGVYPAMSFWYHMYGNSMGTIHIDVSTDTGATYTNDIIPAFTSNMDAWQQKSVDLNAYSGQAIKIRIRGITGNGTTSDMALDDFLFTMADSIDVAISGIVSQSGAFCNYPQNDVCVQIANPDTVPIDSFVLGVDINGGVFYAPQVIVATIPPGSDTIICLGSFALTNGDVIDAAVSLPNGLSDNALSNNAFNQVVTLSPLPTVAPGVDTAICPADTIVLGGSPTGPLGSTYLWSSSGYLDDSTIANPAVSVSAQTTFYITVTDSLGCANNDSVEVDVLALPVVDAGIDTALCKGIAYTLGGAPTGPAGSTYLWAPSADLNDSSLANPTLTVNDTNQFTVVVTDANGCVNTDTVNIAQFAQSFPNAGPDDTICIFDSLQIGMPASALFTSYAWSPATLLDDDSIARPLAYVPADTAFVLQVTDTFGCVFSDTVEIFTHALPVVNAGPDTVVCAGDSIVLGGNTTGPAGSVFAWSSPLLLTDPTATNPVAAVPQDTFFVVTVTDTNGCLNSDTIVIGTFPLPLADAGAGDTVCFADIVLLGGFPAGPAGASYQWTPTGILDFDTIANPQLAVTSVMGFNLQVTDTNTCVSNDSVYVAIHPQFSLIAGADTTVCQNDTFSIGLPVSTAFESFQWFPIANVADDTVAQTSAWISDTVEFTLVATDTFGCSVADTFIVNAFPLPLADAGADTVLCFDEAYAIGGAPTGTPGSLYAWSSNLNSFTDPGTSNPIVVFDSAGIFDFAVTVTDANGCNNSDTVSIIVRPEVFVDAGPDQSVCYGDPVLLGGFPAGPNGAQYLWTPDTNLSFDTIANPSITVTGFSGYNLQVTDTNGCVNNDSVYLGLHPQLTLNIGSDTTLCGLDTFAIGNPVDPAFDTFQWTPAANVVDPAVAQTSAWIDDTTNFVLVASDTFGCSYVDTMTVNLRPFPLATAGLDDTVCFDEVHVLGGAPTGPAGATFQWASDFDGAVIPDTANPVVQMDSAGVFAFIVTVTDTFGCWAVDTSIVTVRDEVPVDAGLSSVVCIGDSVVLGGFPAGPAGAVFTWLEAGLMNDSTLSNPMALVQDTLTFHLTVKDTVGCFGNDSVTVFTYPDPLVDAGPDMPLCIGDTTTLGGTPTATNFQSITWSPVDSLSSSSDANPMSYPQITTEYFLVVTDTFGCSFTDSVTISVGSPVAIDAGADTTVCAFAEFMVGGSPTAPANSTFAWTPATLFNDPTLANPLATVSSDTVLYLNVIDSNGCSISDSIVVTILPIPGVDAGMDTVRVCKGQSVQIGGAPTGDSTDTYLWSPGQFLDDSTLANPTVVGQFSQVYTVVLTDTLSGCTNSDSLYLQVDTLPSANAGLDQIMCNGDTVQIGGSPTSGTGTVFQWLPNTFMSHDTVPNPLVFPQDTTDYILTVYDSNGCFNHDTVVVTVNPLPIVTFNAPPTICAFDSVQLVASGGESYVWNNAAYLTDDTLANPMAFPPDTTVFVVTVTDSNNCSAVDSIAVNTFDLPIVEAGADTQMCFGNSFQFTGTMAPNPVWWPETGLDNSNILNPTTLATATIEYFLTGTDAHGCTATDSVTLTVNQLPTVDAGPNLDQCQLDSVQLGGSPTSAGAMFYNWDNDAFLNDDSVANPWASVTVPTTFMVVVTDTNGCVNSDDVTVDVLVKPVVTASGVSMGDTFCPGTSVQLFVSGADSIYSWLPLGSISDPDTVAPTVFPDVTTDYIVTGVSVNGCTDTDTIRVNVFPPAAADAGPDVEMCFGDTVQLSATGGDTFSWSPALGLSATNISDPISYTLETRVYTLTVRDSIGCLGTDQVKVTVNPLPIVSAGPDLVTCQGSGVKIGGTPTASGNGLSYSWTPAAWLNNPAVANPIATPDTSTVFKVTVQTMKGCIDTASMTVEVDSVPVIGLVSPEPVCLYDTSMVTVPLGYSNYEWTPSEHVFQGPGDTVFLYTEQAREFVLEVTDSNGCKGSDTVLVEIMPLPVISISSAQEACFGDTVRLEATGGDTFAWSPIEGMLEPDSASTNVIASETQEYWVIVTDSNGCVDSSSTEVLVHPLPLVDAGEDVVNCDVEIVMLGGEPTGPAVASFFWEPQDGLDNPFSPNPVVLSPERTVYQVTVEDVEGCRNTDSVLVNADCFPVIYVPSAFTPGQDDANDLFKVVHHRIVDTKLEIYDRWGRMVFQTSDLDIGWDGSYMDGTGDCPSSVYAWTLKYKSEEGKKLSKQGLVTLIR